MERESFDDMITRVAGAALFKLIKGQQWESIVHGIALQVILWRKKEDDADGQ